MVAAAVVKKAVDSLHLKDPYAKIMVMGDFNDGPYNKSISEVVGAKYEKEDVGLKELYNPYETILRKGGGTIAYRGSWDVFDQIFFTAPLLEEEYSEYRYYKSGIFSPPFLQNPREVVVSCSRVRENKANDPITIRNPMMKTSLKNKSNG